MFKPVAPLNLKSLSDSEHIQFTASTTAITSSNETLKMTLVFSPKQPVSIISKLPAPVLLSEGYGVPNTRIVASKYKADAGAVLQHGWDCLVGVGAVPKTGECVTPINVKSVGMAIASTMKACAAPQVVIDCSKVKGVCLRDMHAFVLFGLYNNDHYKCNKSKIPQLATGSVHYLLSEGTDAFLSMGVSLAKYMTLAFELTEAPPNFLTPISFVEKVGDVAKRVSPQIQTLALTYKECLQLGFGGFCCIAQGMEADLARFMVMVYVNKPTETTPWIALVGKGVTHDTGGYNIKSGATGIHEMHVDMNGASMAAATFLHVVENQKDGESIKLMCVTPLVENLISETAVIPGDIVNTYSGQSVKIINTDAEGRMILADGLTWAEEFMLANMNANPQLKAGDRFKAGDEVLALPSPHKDFRMRIISIATLTGAQVVALGDGIAAYFTNDDEAVAIAEAANKKSWECVWRLPIHAPYQARINDNLADLGNLGNVPVQAGSCIAAGFLANFVRSNSEASDAPKVSYMHFDVAGPSWIAKSATPYGPMYFTNLVKMFNEFKP